MSYEEFVNCDNCGQRMDTGFRNLGEYRLPIPEDWMESKTFIKATNTDGKEVCFCCEGCRDRYDNREIKQMLIRKITASSANTIDENIKNLLILLENNGG